MTHVDVKTTTITVEGGENPGIHQYDLIIGADGAGSIVRRCMNDQIEDFTAEKFEGKHFIKNLYLDNREEVKKHCSPNRGYLRSILGYPTIFATLKYENNETAIGICHVGPEKKLTTIPETRKFLKKIDVNLSAMMTDESVERFMK